MGHNNENDANNHEIEIYYDNDGNFLPVTNISFPELDDSESKDESFPEIESKDESCKTK